MGYVLREVVKRHSHLKQTVASEQKMEYYNYTRVFVVLVTCYKFTNKKYRSYSYKQKCVLRQLKNE